jgi:hypothetical protein
VNRCQGAKSKDLVKCSVGYCYGGGVCIVAFNTILGLGKTIA